MSTNNSPWKLTITRSWSASKASNSNALYFALDKKYKSYTRWEHKLTNVSVITNLKVEKTDKFTLAPGDSYTVVLKIRGIAEKTMGTIDCVTPAINYNPKPWLANIKKTAVYVKVLLYEKPSGISSTNAYQSGADNYNIFMSELRCIWRNELTNTLINDKMVKGKIINKDKDLPMPQMYELCKSLHKRCKSEKAWKDMETAFNTSFGKMDNKNKNNKNKNNYNANKNWNFNYSGAPVGNVNNNFMTPPQPQNKQPQSSNPYNLRSRRKTY